MSPPSPQVDPPPLSPQVDRKRQKKCWLGPHLLKQPSRIIEDRNLLRFAKRVNSELRLGAAVCQTCYETLLQVYHMRRINKIKHTWRQEPVLPDAHRRDRLT